jgi:hypothetical protein
MIGGFSNPSSWEPMGRRALTGMCERLVALEIDPVVDLHLNPPDRKG